MALRASMQHLVDNLQFHLQVDVLEGNFAQLLARIQESRVRVR